MNHAFQDLASVASNDYLAHAQMFARAKQPQKAALIYKVYLSRGEDEPAATAYIAEAYFAEWEQTGVSIWNLARLLLLIA